MMLQSVRVELEISADRWLDVSSVLVGVQGALAVAEFHCTFRYDPQWCGPDLRFAVGQRLRVIWQSEEVPEWTVIFGPGEITQIDLPFGAEPGVVYMTVRQQLVLRDTPYVRTLDNWHVMC